MICKKIKDKINPFKSILSSASRLKKRKPCRKLSYNRDKALWIWLNWLWAWEMADWLNCSNKQMLIWFSGWKVTVEFLAGIHIDNLMKMTLRATCPGSQHQKMMAPLTQVLRGRVQPAKSTSPEAQWLIISVFSSLRVLFTKITLSPFYTTPWAGFILTVIWVKVWESPHKLPCLSKVDNQH